MTDELLIAKYVERNTKIKEYIDSRTPVNMLYNIHPDLLNPGIEYATDLDKNDIRTLEGNIATTFKKGDLIHDINGTVAQFRKDYNSTDNTFRVYTITAISAGREGCKVYKLVNEQISNDVDSWYYFQTENLKDWVSGSTANDFKVGDLLYDSKGRIGVIYGDPLNSGANAMTISGVVDVTEPVIYLKNNGDDTMDGLTTNTAVKSLNKAADLARSTGYNIIQIIPGSGFPIRCTGNPYAYYNLEIRGFPNGDSVLIELQNDAGNSLYTLNVVYCKLKLKGSFQFRHTVTSLATDLLNINEGSVEVDGDLALAVSRNISSPNGMVTLNGVIKANWISLLSQGTQNANAISLSLNGGITAQTIIETYNIANILADGDGGAKLLLITPDFRSSGATTIFPANVHGLKPEPF